MAATDSVVVVLDAGPLIHLDELVCLHLLEGFDELLIPTIVWNEASRHRPLLNLKAIPVARLADPHGHPPLSLASASFAHELHAGEIAAITLLHEAGGGLLLSDDDAARQTAEALGFSVTGTLGLLLRGIRRKQIPSAQVRQIAAEIPQRSTLHVSRALLKRFADAIPS